MKRRLFMISFSTFQNLLVSLYFQTLIFLKSPKKLFSDFGFITIRTRLATILTWRRHYWRSLTKWRHVVGRTTAEFFRPRRRIQWNQIISGESEWKHQIRGARRNRHVFRRQEVSHQKFARQADVAGKLPGQIFGQITTSWYDV